MRPWQSGDEDCCDWPCQSQELAPGLQTFLPGSPMYVPGSPKHSFASSFLGHLNHKTASISGRVEAGLRASEQPAPAVSLL